MADERVAIAIQRTLEAGVREGLTVPQWRELSKLLAGSLYVAVDRKGQGVFGRPDGSLSLWYRLQDRGVVTVDGVRVYLQPWWPTEREGAG